MSEPISEPMAAMLDWLDEWARTTEMGRQWAAGMRARDDLERRLIVLRKRGLSDRLVDDLWRIGDLSLLPPIEGASNEDIAALNAAA